MPARQIRQVIILMVLIALFGSAFTGVEGRGERLKPPLQAGAGAIYPDELKLSLTIGAEASRVPLIILPGLTGSRLENDPEGDGLYGEVWPNGDRLLLDPWDRSLLQLKLSPDGYNPYQPEPQYTSVRVGDIIRTEYLLDYYASTIQFFTNQGYVEGKDLFACPYDWRKDIEAIAFGTLPNTLDRCISNALALNTGATRVDLLAHSMGGMIARVYLADPVRAQRVRRLVTLGTPLLGAPKMALAILAPLCYAEWLGLCFTNRDVLYELVQDFSSGYEIAPGAGYFQVYPKGYIRRDRDSDGDGQRDGYLDPEEILALFAQHNATLAEKASQLENRLGSWASYSPNGTEVFAIVGDQHASIGTLVEYEKRPWFNPWGTASIAYRAEPANGDGTVPLHSADMRDPARGIDLTGGVPVFYFSLEHDALAKDPGVLGLAAGIFAAPAKPDLSSLLQTAQGAEPRTQPLPLDGFWLGVDGPVDVEVRDANGRQINSPNKTSTISAMSGSGPTVPAIPGAAYTEAGDSAYIFLPVPGSYLIKLSGQADGGVRVRVQTLASDRVEWTHLYEDLTVMKGSAITLALDPAAGGPGNISLDQNGDGKFEASYPSSSILDVQQSQDITPPVLAAEVRASISPDWQYSGPATVALSAIEENSGAGLARIEYSLDGGTTTLQYSAPFNVDPGVVQTILARAIDRAGNESGILTVQLVPKRIFLPLALKY